MSLTLSSELSASLKANGCNLEGAELDSLFQGILAAPRSVDNSWLQLFGDNLNETACDLLIDARRSAYEEMDAGFTEGPAPAYRLDNLRQAMQEQGIDAFLIPRTDEFLGEYVPEYADRLYWLTGFSGSAGIAIVMQDKAAIFVDGRYTIQVAGEVNDDLFEIAHLLNQPPHKWVQAHLSEGQVLGIDPLLHNKRSFDLFKSATDTVSACIKLLSSNPVDQVWQNQPARPIGAVLPHALDYAGQSAEEKIVSISGALKDKNIDEVVITASDSIAWLLNIRGGDVARCPLPLSYLVLSREGKVRLFIDSRKLPHGTKTYLAERQ